MVLTASEAISNVLVLRAAWLRADGWYRGGGIAPEPELSRWRLHPEAELRKLSRELREGTWVPEPWQQVPYPKRTSCLRHYVVPTVRDQVAFLAHIVLLGPLLDEQLHNFAFGNRWYRPIVWNRRLPTPRWEKRPYPFATGKSYLPYSRSHGLFRRAAYWTVARMTKASIRKEDYAGRVQHVEDYDAESLPAWTRSEWWKGTEGDRAYWAGLDIQMAYPSIRLERLRLGFERMLVETCPEPRVVFQGAPISYRGRAREQWGSHGDRAPANRRVERCRRCAGANLRGGLGASQGALATRGYPRRFWRVAYGIGDFGIASQRGTA